MGNTLATQLQWTSPNSSIDGNGKDSLPLLAVSVVNQDLLYDIVRFVDHACSAFPSEVKTEFRKPLQWPSLLRPSQFQGNPAFTVVGNSGNYLGCLIAEYEKTLETNKKLRTKAGVVSTANRMDGTPIFALEQTQGDDKLYIAKLSSIEYLHKILAVADDQKLKELQEIVQANRDPLYNISGIPGKSGNVLLQALESINKDTDDTPAKKEQTQRLYRLLLVLNNFELQMLQQAVKGMERDRNIDMQKVAEELQMLQSFCSRDSKSALISIDWESDYIFANGYRAPPWRQVYGELSYLEVQPFDGQMFIATATKRGFYKIKGYENDGKGNERLNYEKCSDIFPSLVDLLKNQSKHFADKIDKQDYSYQSRAAHDGLSGKNQESEHKNSQDQQENNKHEEAQDAHEGDEKGGNGYKNDGQRKNAIKKKSHPTKSRAIEPSLKWRALGLNDKKVRKNGGATSFNDSSRAGAWDDKYGRRRASGSFASEDEEDYGDSESASGSDEESSEKRPDMSEMPAEYWQIQKLVKYLRCGNQTATIIAICSLRDFDLMNETNQLAIRDVGGLTTLINLLDTEDPKCKIGALKILKDIAQNVQIRSSIADLDGMQPLVELLKDMDEEVKCLAAETISHCAKNGRNRRAVRKYGGIRKLVRLLKPANTKSDRVAISGALALATCSRSSKNKRAIQEAGAIPLLATLLETKNEQLLIPVVTILQECASDENYRIAIRTSGMIKFLVENLSSKNQELQTHCASAIFKCAEDDEARILVRQYGGLNHLVNLLDSISNKEVLVAVTGAIWKCAQNLDNVIAFNKLNTVKRLVGLMDNQPEDVLVNVVGALGACAQSNEGRQAIRESSGITPLVGLLTSTNQALLVNVTTAIGACALDSDSMAIIDRLDGVRLLWSQLKSPSHQVQASAAWAICPCIEHAKDAGEMVRSFVGGLELIVSLLKSEHVEVLASVCAAVANIAKDEENLAVITDHGVVPMLAKLTNTRNDKLRRHLAEAIARCCHWGNNRVAFGSAGAVAPLVKYLKSPDDEVHRSTAKALHQLSMDPDNCITMHEHGVVQLLLGMVGSSDPSLQEAAAGTIGNIRRLALASEKAALS